ncbi:MAG: SUMF1/EgtB/PvdO family nonheme iron enzyme [Lentisphaeria bacterium]|nr:SUMF1/EgtB/PvdO family nonheme iron enzyme [Lentisphaeria bacterium]
MSEELPKLRIRSEVDGNLQKKQNSETGLVFGALLKNRFQIQKSLDSSVHGASYLVKDLQGSDLLVAKQLSPAAFRHNNDRFEYLKANKGITGLKFRNIAEVISVFEEDDYLYAVRKYIEGVNLKTLMEVDATLDTHEREKKARTILHDICKGVKDLGPEFIHGNINLNNVLWSEEEPKGWLVDFGFKNLQESQIIQFIGNDMLKRYFVAPELVEQSTETTEQSDVYSIGMVILSYLSGEVPQGNPLDQCDRLSCSGRLKHILEYCLEYNPDKRWHCPSHVLAVLEGQEIQPGIQVKFKEEPMEEEELPEGSSKIFRVANSQERVAAQAQAQKHTGLGLGKKRRRNNKKLPSPEPAPQVQDSTVDVPLNHELEAEEESVYDPIAPIEEVVQDNAADPESEGEELPVSYIKPEATSTLTEPAHNKTVGLIAVIAVLVVVLGIVITSFVGGETAKVIYKNEALIFESQRLMNEITALKKNQMIRDLHRLKKELNVLENQIQAVSAQYQHDSDYDAAMLVQDVEPQLLNIKRYTKSYRLAKEKKTAYSAVDFVTIQTQIDRLKDEHVQADYKQKIHGVRSAAEKAEKDLNDLKFSEAREGYNLALMVMVGLQEKLNEDLQSQIKEEVSPFKDFLESVEVLPEVSEGEFVEHSPEVQGFLLKQKIFLEQGYPKHIMLKKSKIIMVLVPPVTEGEQPYYLSKTELTALQWEEVLNVKNDVKSGTPAQEVSYKDATEFIVKLNQYEEVAQAKFQLPTEKEWLNASLVGENIQQWYQTDEELIGRQIWSSANSVGEVQKSGTMNANQLGIHDMLGSLWEWCLADDGSLAPLRGGAYNLPPEVCTPDSRIAFTDDFVQSTFGLRLAMKVTPKQ